MSEQDRLRAKLAHEFARELAERMYQVDKGCRLARLGDLQTESARQAYVDAALAALLGSQASRIQAVQSAIAQHHAIKDDESETVQRLARQDVAKYGSGRTH